MSALEKEFHLYIDEQHVGIIRPGRNENSWNFGEFEPLKCFSKFAPMFGRWSLLMHADSDIEPLSSAAADELREAEREIDGHQFRLFSPVRKQWIALVEVNIDGNMIEWRET